MGLTYRRDALRPSAVCFSYQESLADDAEGQMEGQMARFVTKTLRVCSGLVLLMYCT